MLTQTEINTIQGIKSEAELKIFEQTGKHISISYKYLEPVKHVIAIEDITDLVCRLLDINYEDVFSKTRKTEIVEARHISMYLGYIYSGLSLKKLGRLFNRDHSTVIHAREKIGGYIMFDKDFKQKFNSIETTLIETFNVTQ